MTNHESIEKRIFYLRDVEKLSQRQVAETLKVDRKRIKRVLEGGIVKPPSKPLLLAPYRDLISHWYKEHPRLQACQIYERLKPYGFQGSHSTVARFTKEHRIITPPAYHHLSFLPGEEAQIDWFFFRHPKLGMMAGFLYILAFSRYGWGKFYPRTTFEFFIKGHLEVFSHLGGLARRHRYDNLKSVVLRRNPTLEYNSHFLDFARHFGFSIHACNPYRGNEKGVVERLVRIAREFLYGRDIDDYADLNRQFQDLLKIRNEKLHRVTGKAPVELLAQERLIMPPDASYLPRRIVPALVSKTCLVEFETNRYSVPTGYQSKTVDIIAFPERIEVCAGSKIIARHARSFDRKKVIQNPLHADKLLNKSPNFKIQRILQLIRDMDPSFRGLVDMQEDDKDQKETAYQIFRLLKTHSRKMVISAARELVSMGIYKPEALLSLLNLPSQKKTGPVWPKNSKLLDLNYEERSLDDYDPD